MNEEQALQAWKALYKAPFTFKFGVIFDANHNMVADDVSDEGAVRIRGWGRISSHHGDKDGALIQDAGGRFIAELLTKGFTPSISEG